MSFSIIEVIALFFIAINIFIVIVFFFVWLDGFLLKKSRIKSEREYYVNDCLLRVILSYCEYAKFKKEKKVYLRKVNNSLPKTVINQLNSKYGYKVIINHLGEIVISGGELDDE